MTATSVRVTHARRRKPIIGPAWTPPRPRPRAPRALRHLPTRDRAELTAVLSRYRDLMLGRAWHPKMRALFAALPGSVRPRVEHDAVVAAALSADPTRLVAVEDHAGRITLASTLHPTQEDR